MTCAQLTCPKPMVMKPNPQKLQCKPFSGGCNYGYCCMMPTTTPVVTVTPPPPTTPCPTTTPCATTTPMPTSAPTTCKKFYCPAGYLQVAKAEKKVCHSVYGCSIAMCCSKIPVIKPSPTTTPCPTT